MRLIPSFAVSVLLGAAWPQTPLAQARTPVVQSLDVAVHRAPETVRIGGRSYLIYELHLANFLRTEIRVTGIRVLDGDSQDATLDDFRGDDLEAMVGRPGVRGASEARRISPASHAVAYFWIRLPSDMPPPHKVRHRFEMEVLASSGPVSVEFDGAESIVSADAPAIIGPPLRGAAWVAVYHPRLVGGHRTVFYTRDGKARIPGRYAIDWVRLRADGTFAQNDSMAHGESGYGAEVIAVADGVVAEAMDDIADNVGAPTAAAHAPENASGNYVALDIGDGRFAFYEHLQHGSITVKVGDRVRRGQVIGRLGNSGSSSMGPHLHFHVSDAASALGAEGLPFVFDAFEVLGEFPSMDAMRGGARWISAPADQSGERRTERPGPNTVVRFP